MLGDRLPLLRPTPIIALTATATPIVQRDILKQLDVPEAEKHIHGFRRDNIYIELVEMRPGARKDACLELLSPADRRPAIVYAPTRKKAEELARTLMAHMPSAVYHAGIPSAKRDRVQSQFLSGKLEVIVATVAFGMGIDKADVRTVVHTAQPASIEGYYQEIGRAGRDGLPSRAVLYHSYADRRTHEWFLDRDYPDLSILRTVHRALGDTPVPRAVLDQDLRMDPDTIEKALEKLWIHGGAQIDPEDRVSRGHDAWEAPYKAQREHKQAQLDDVGRFAENASCHMLKLVRHFGDQADSGERCGHCASCRPDDSVALNERPATEAEQKVMSEMIDALRERDGQSKGRLHRVLFGDALDRKSFEVLVGSLVRAHFIHEQADSFENEGQTIQFRRLHLTEDGRRVRSSDVATLRVPAETVSSRSSGKSRSPRKPRARNGRQAALDALEAAEAPKAMVDALKRWRTGEAKRRRCPAFRILTDRALMGIAREAPRDEEGLLAVKGMGPTLVKKYGSEILEITKGG
jgi:DNA topoisomerase-3